MTDQNDQVVTPDSGDGPAEPTGGELTADQLAQVRGAFGLKDGQDIPSMITGATKRSVLETLGIEKGKSAKEFFTEIIRANVPQPKPEKDKPEDGDAFAGEFAEMKKTIGALQEEKEKAAQYANEERRRSAIRDALGKFELRSEMKGLMTKAFVSGIEGPKAFFDDAGLLVTQSGNGHEQPFGDFLSGYFEENRGFLATQKFSGSGARNGGAAKSAGNVNTYTSKDGGTFAQDYQADPDGTLARMREATAARKAKLMGR